ncbi:MAG TPA: cytochrome P460 family protein [Terracidiphilus sp.]|jgi:mono/diheme cytochrome c family protein|nr:cytochrome P460 family protein [Terracidiphilus sp.]
MKMLGKLLIACAVLFALLQAVRPGIPAGPATAELQAPAAVKQVFEKNCYSCHSNERRLAWFDEVVPAYWLVRRDILTARRHLNFSTLDSKPSTAQRATLYEAVNMIQLGAMPFPDFVKLHPEARVTPEELATLKNYLAPWSSTPTPVSESAPTGAAARDHADKAAAPVSLAMVWPEFNGLAFDPTFESWKPIGSTDRGDNNTFRFILGNDIAVKAAQSGNISPWPDGARFAKIAWQQQAGADGLVHPGKFVQVELMVKDAQRYKDTEGWSWGRWRGMDLKPYGSGAGFVSECTGCHQPLRGNDYVYTLPITPATITRLEVVNNLAAALPAAMPYQPLGWNVITMFVDQRNRTIAILYGNETAMQSVRVRGDAPTGKSPAPVYPEGAVLALVSWSERDDPHWFGARIPGAPQSVEFVKVSAVSRNQYQRFAGSGLAEQHLAASTETQRTSFVLGLAPVRLP